MAWSDVMPKGKKQEIEKKIIRFEEILRSNKESYAQSQGLMGGTIGIALYFLYYAKLMDKQEPYDIGLETLESVFESINNGFNYHTHAGGLAGIGSVIELLREDDLIELDSNDTLGALDKHLYKMMMHEIKNKNYDFLHGAVGIGYYFIRRKSNKSYKIYLTDLIEELDKNSTKDEEGIRWLSVLDKEKKTKGFNLSLSHGLASIIVFLSKVYKEGIAKEKTLILLQGAVKYLINQKLDTSKHKSNFPSWVCEGEPSMYSRMAWCYGDLGIGIALWLAAENTTNEEWKNKAVEILLHTTKRKTAKETGVVDAGLCHGTAGIAHIYNRMYNFTNRNEFKESAVYWFNKTLELNIYNDTLSGYKAHRSEKYGGSYEDFGFLEGIAGIGLAFISAISNIEPVWDETLFLS